MPNLKFLVDFGIGMVEGGGGIFLPFLFRNETHKNMPNKVKTTKAAIKC